MKSLVPLVVFAVHLASCSLDPLAKALGLNSPFLDDRAEQTHDYVQWLFPLDEPSGSVQGAPVLSDLDIDEIKKSPAAQAYLIKASEWFFQFLNRNQRWVAKYDHKQLRITRAIRSLRLLVGDIEADNFRQSIFDYLGEDVDLIGEKAKSFWKGA